MLKDSLIVDPTFVQFNEMFAYAQQELTGLLVPFDNGVLEDDRSKWDKDLMNAELVEIVNNFSVVRIEHLKKVISVVLADKIRSTKIVKPQRPSHEPSKTHVQLNGNISSEEKEEQKRSARKQALSQLTNSSKMIGRVMDDMQSRGEWALSDIQKLENAANQILIAARNYKNNK